MRLFYKKMQFFISFPDISLVMLFPYTNIPVINDIKLNTSVSSLYFLSRTFQPPPLIENHLSALLHFVESVTQIVDHE